MYRLLVSVLCLLLVLGSVALSVGAETEATDQPTDPSEAADAPREASALDEAFAYRFTLNQKDYELPFAISELLNDGWSFVDEDDANRSLTVSTIPMRKQKSTSKAVFFNMAKAL